MPSAMLPDAADAAVTRSWVADTFGVALDDAALDDVALDDVGAGESVTALVQLGLRRNPRRAHLLVSTVLGKHIPTDPSAVRGAADRLADRVRDLLGTATARDATVLGFAETATGLGHCVADRLDAACYLHSTRRREPGVTVAASFEEGHSHATTHLVEPSDAALFAADELPLILVDDEISTGRTALEAIAALHRQAPRNRYVVASLVDLRSPRQRAECDSTAADLGITVDFVALAGGELELPAGFTETVCALDAPDLNPIGPRPGTLVHLASSWPAEVPDGGRHGFLRTDRAEFRAGVTRIADDARDHLAADRPLVVIGHEEFMYLPLCVAENLAAQGFSVRYQTTTRSPAHVRDEPGYPLRRGFEFAAPEGDAKARRYLYNVAAPDGSDVELPQVLFVADRPAATADLDRTGGLLDVLTAAGHDVVSLVVDTPTQRSLRTAREADS